MNYSANVPSERAKTVSKGGALLLSEQLNAFYSNPHANEERDHVHIPTQSYYVLLY